MAQPARLPLLPPKFVEHSLEHASFSEPSSSQMCIPLQARKLERESENSDLEADTRGTSWSTAAIGTECSVEDLPDHIPDVLKRRMNRPPAEPRVLAPEELHGPVAFPATTERPCVFRRASGEPGGSAASPFQIDDDIASCQEEEDEERGESYTFRRAVQDEREFGMGSPRLFPGDEAPLYQTDCYQVTNGFISGTFSPAKTTRELNLPPSPRSLESYSDEETFTGGPRSKRETSLFHTIGGPVFSPRGDSSSLAIHVAVMDPHSTLCVDPSPFTFRGPSRQARSPYASAGVLFKCSNPKDVNRVRFKQHPLCLPRSPLRFSTSLAFPTKGLSPGNLQWSLLPSHSVGKARGCRPTRTSGTHLRRSVSTCQRQVVPSEETGGNRHQKVPHLSIPSGAAARNRLPSRSHTSNLSSRPLSCPPRRAADRRGSDYAQSRLVFPASHQPGQSTYRRYLPDADDFILPTDGYSTPLLRQPVATPRVSIHQEKKCSTSARGVRAGRSTGTNHTPKLSSCKKVSGPETKGPHTRAQTKGVETGSADIGGLREPARYRFSPTVNSSPTRRCLGSAGLGRFETELTDRALKYEARHQNITRSGSAQGKPGTLLSATAPDSSNAVFEDLAEAQYDLAAGAATGGGRFRDPSPADQRQVQSPLCPKGPVLAEDVCGISSPSGLSARRLTRRYSEGFAEDSHENLTEDGRDVEDAHNSQDAPLTARKAKQTDSAATPRGSTAVFARTSSPSGHMRGVVRTGVSSVPKQATSMAGMRRESRRASIPGTGRQEPESSRPEAADPGVSSPSRGGAVRGRPPVDPLALAIHAKLLESGIIPGPLSLWPRGRPSSPGVGKRSNSASGEPSADPWQLLAAALAQVTARNAGSPTRSRTSRWMEGASTARSHCQSLPFKSLYSVNRRDLGFADRLAPSTEAKAPWESDAGTSARRLYCETTEVITHDGIADSCSLTDILEDVDPCMSQPGSLAGELLTPLASSTLCPAATAGASVACGGHTADRAERTKPNPSEGTKQSGGPDSQAKATAAGPRARMPLSVPSSGRLSCRRKPEGVTGARSAARPGPGTKLVQNRQSASSQEKGWVENPDGFSKFFCLRWLPDAATLGQLREQHRAEIVASAPGVQITPSAPASSSAAAADPKSKKATATASFDAFDAEKLLPYQIVNKFPDTTGLTTRVGLLKNLRAFTPFLLDKPHVAIVPRTYILNDEDEVTAFRVDYILTRAEATLKLFLLRWAYSLPEATRQMILVSSKGGLQPSPTVEVTVLPAPAADPPLAGDGDSAVDIFLSNISSTECSSPRDDQETPGDEPSDCTGGSAASSNGGPEVSVSKDNGPSMHPSRVSLCSVLSEIVLLEENAEAATTKEELLLGAVKSALPKLAPRAVKAAIYAADRARAHRSRAAVLLDCPIVSETEQARLEETPLHLLAGIDTEKADAVVEALLAVIGDTDGEAAADRTSTEPSEETETSGNVEGDKPPLPVAPQLVREAADALRWLRKRGREQWSLNGWSSAWVLKSACNSKGAPPASVCHRLADIEKMIRGKYRPQLLIQKLVETPLTVNGKKFDIRMFALVTSWSPLTGKHRLISNSSGCLVVQGGAGPGCRGNEGYPGLQVYDAENVSSHTICSCFPLCTMEVKLESWMVQGGDINFIIEYPPRLAKYGLLNLCNSSCKTPAETTFGVLQFILKCGK
ncbi:putative tubulin-tyrosine ligase family domain containing protein [Neospora caninum Liverpool]|uniref:Putative tubulin-tyrosine ligase family domain containing protein n=1 Tax=Neospora caninum (strain Liverpool) TaxID=572307 RepID=F0VBF6_NEOCL|nr:putative tubulin-tyrosine ligase family domain containing protein [Neospora caninum Liverpool]CBZ50940.1 putative tubulin-tyrosine ligase family domain containing protein [Neospora caninum Liverpool]|eukprot:XP_003880973.1 putative tubulin-tyrosine ligase family domain containing protein [Neospora caninum Liverpool]